MPFEPRGFLARDLVFVYANRDTIQTVAGAFDTSAVAMAGGIAAATVVACKRHNPSSSLHDLKLAA
jgi:hypothetical protein